MPGNSAPVYESQVSSNKKYINHRLGHKTFCFHLDIYPIGPIKAQVSTFESKLFIMHTLYICFMLVKRMEILTFFSCKYCYPPKYRAGAY